MEMVGLIAALGRSYRLTLIGRVDEASRQELDAAMQATDTAGRIELLDRLDHEESWRWVCHP
jgi:hypothetical protein